MFSSILYRAYNILISSAAADIAFETFTYLSFGGIRIVFEQLIRSHDHPRSAKAALETMLLPETFLNGMQTTLWGESFNCCHFTSIYLYGKNCACFGGLAIYQYRASATLRSVTTNMCSCQIKNIS